MAKARWFLGGILPLVVSSCTIKSEPIFVVNEQPTCSNETPATEPNYFDDVRPILEQSCTRCHGTASRYGAPPFLRLDRFQDVTLPGGEVVYGAASAAGCLCATAVQADPESPLSMPFPAFSRPICDGDRETLRNWINQGATLEGHEQQLDLCASRATLTSCLVAQAPAAPTYEEHVRPILAARCLSCHSSPRCFGARPQPYLRLDDEHPVRLGCPGDTPPASEQEGQPALCIDGLPVRVVERGVGVAAYRGEIVRAAADRLESVAFGGTNMIGPMPYRPTHQGGPVDLVPPLCDSERQTLRRWALQQDGARGAECVTTELPAVPSWRLDAKRILAGRCGICHGERNRAQVSPPFRLDVYRRTEPGGPPGVDDVREWCVNVPAPGANVSILPGTSVPQSNGVVEVLGKTFAVEAGPCTPASSAPEHVRVSLKVVDLVKLVAIDREEMPYGPRARLCDTDRQTLARWRTQSAQGALKYE